MTFWKTKILFQERFMLYCKRFTNIHMNKPRLKHQRDDDDDFDITKLKDVADYLEKLTADDDDEYLKKVSADAREDLDRVLDDFPIEDKDEE